ncbi:MAG: glutathione S-transferase N-terminal domain-containing protein [Pseudomonadota bacterium]
MKLFFRYFFRTLRFILGPILILWEIIFSPRGIVRPPEEQSAIDNKTQYLSLYQYPTCPFCIKVRRQIKRLSLNIELRNTRDEGTFRQELLNQGGKTQVPCLKITNPLNEQSEWLYESDTINSYLDKNFG